MFVEAFHSTVKVIHLVLEVKTSFNNSTPMTSSSMKSSLARNFLLDVKDNLSRNAMLNFKD
jgi:hypothetical protein